MRKIGLTLFIVCILSSLTFGQDTTLAAVQLPAPRMTGGKPLMEALKDRKTGRDYMDKALDQQMLSNLLWAAFGVNRPESGRRTAPSAMNKQEVLLYVSIKEGSYLYNAIDNKLEPVAAGDNRSKMGIQSFAGEAAVVITYVADYSVMAGLEKDKEFYSGVDAGYISQNVYLFCASEGLSTVALGFINREKIVETLKLDKNKKVILSQCVGFPKE